jgi:hypothetical protein
MKNTCLSVAIVLVLVAASARFALSQAAQPPARTDVYHVLFATAAPGRASQVADFLKTPGKVSPTAPNSNHFLVLRHQDGAEWDYVVITHLGTSATVKPGVPPPPPSVLEATACHADTFVSGPAWPEFARAMGIDQDPSKTADSVYVVSVYRPAPGHGDQLEKALLNPAPGTANGGLVLMQHLEGGPWQYFAVTRYNSWQDFGTGEANSVAQTRKGSGGWYDLREHIAFHTDTATDRIAP